MSQPPMLANRATFAFPMVAQPRTIAAASAQQQHPESNNTVLLLNLMSKHHADILQLNEEHKKELQKKDEEHRLEMHRLTEQNDARVARLMSFMTDSNGHMATLANNTVGCYNRVMDRLIMTANPIEPKPAEPVLALPPPPPPPPAEPMRALTLPEALKSPSDQSVAPTSSARQRNRQIVAAAAKGARLCALPASIFIGQVHIGKGLNIDDKGIGQFKCKCCTQSVATKALLVGHFETVHADVLHQKQQERRAAAAQKRSAHNSPTDN